MWKYSVYDENLVFNLFRDEFTVEELAARGVVEEQQTRQEFFLNLVGFNYKKFAEMYGCDIALHERRIYEARELWIKDLRRVHDGMPGTKHLDQFKRAAYLAYWLRRRIVVDEISPLSAPADPGLVEVFEIFGNEICAFLIGYHFCLRFAAGARPRTHLQELLLEFNLDKKLVEDIAVYLKNKNVSPPALYLMYRLIFRH